MNTKITVIGVSRDEHYNDQRNNRVVPHRACNVTSYDMSSRQAGWLIPHEPSVGAADTFMKHMEQPRLYDEMIDSYPWSYRLDDDGQVIPIFAPSQVHDMLAREFNVLVGANAARFSTVTPIRDAMFTLFTAGGAVISGDFPYRGRRLRHMVSLVEIATIQPDVWKITRPDQFDPVYIQWYTIDDPFGDVHAGYPPGVSGNNIKLSPTEFHDIVRAGKTPGTIWAHLIQAKNRRSVA